MKSVNKVILLGRLGADPALKETSNGGKLVRFSIATTQTYYREGVPSGEKGEDSLQGKIKEEKTEWHQVVAWGRLATRCSQYLKKGHPVYLEGALKHRKYLSADQTEKFVTEVVAEEVSFLPSRSTASLSPASPETLLQ